MNSPSGASEREAFEKWLDSPQSSQAGGDYYSSPHVQSMWQVWQAASAGRNELAEALERSLSHAEKQRMEYRARATKAEQEAAEWKQRFDILLRRDESNGV